MHPDFNMPALSIPTTSALPPSQRIPSADPSVFRILNRLTRSSLLSLVLDWLDEQNQALAAPYLASDNEDNEDDQDLYPAAQSLEELQEFYNELQARKGSKREIVDRVIEGDWRHGLSLYQLAMADLQYLYDHPTSQKWTALKVVQLKTDGDSEEGQEPQRDIDLPCIPRFHPPTFLQNLQREILPDVKAHYNLDRHKSLPLLILRIYLLDSPYNTSLALANAHSNALDTSKTVYIGIPDASPNIFISLTTSVENRVDNRAADARSLRKLILDGLAKAFSRARRRYGLQSTNFSARSLESLITRRGPGRTNAAGGGWSIYGDDKRKDDTPLNTHLPTPSVEESDDDKENAPPSITGMKRTREKDTDAALRKRRKLIAAGRFGDSAYPDDRKGIERLDIRIEDPFPTLPTGQPNTTTFPDDEAEAQAAAEARSGASNKRRGRRSTITEELDRDRGEDFGPDWVPDIRITFHGSHVFAGVRRLVEMGVVDGERMPGWMTGEEGVSVGVVREGRITGFKGSGV